MTARAIERFSNAFSPFRPSEEQRQRIWQDILAKKSVLAYFEFPDRIGGPDPRVPYRASLAVPRSELEVSIPSEFNKALHEYLNASDILQIQTRIIPDGGNVWVIKDQLLKKRIKFVLGKVLWIPASLQVKNNGRWDFLDKLPTFAPEVFEAFIDFTRAFAHEAKALSVVNGTSAS